LIFWYRSPGEDDAVDVFFLEEGQSHGHGQVGFPGSGRADPEDQVKSADSLDVLLLVETLGIHRFSGETQGLGGKVGFQSLAVSPLKEVQGDVEVLFPERAAPLLELTHLLEVEPGELDLLGLAVHDQAVSSDRKAHSEAAFELAQVPVEDSGKDAFPDIGVSEFFHFRGQGKGLQSLISLTKHQTRGIVKPADPLGFAPFQG
jgi:hypothetical protein